MKLNCDHGYFKFYEMVSGEISDFVSLYGLDLVREGDFYTFEFLSGAPKYSIAGLPYLGILAIKTFEGAPSEIMRENNLVYDFNKGLVVPILSVIQRVKITPTGQYFMSDGLILPGSVTDDGKRVTDYAAWYLPNSQRYKYSEVTYG